MTSKLEKISAPVVVFNEQIRFIGTYLGRICLAKQNGQISRGFASFSCRDVEAIFDLPSKRKWTNHKPISDFEEKLRKDLGGTHIFFSDGVHYEGSDIERGLHCFSFLKRSTAEYTAHRDYRQQYGVSAFNHDEISAILDRNGGIIWKKDY